MAGGYTGKILHVNLTTRVIKSIDSKPYTDKYGGAHGVGSAIFWDEVVEKGDWDMLDGFDSKNQISIMSGPLTGTLTPCSGRSEVQGVAPQKWPVNWFSRSGFGGRFGNMMKHAGWDGVAITGKATSPVWLNIINESVTIEDAGPDGDNIWGLNTWEAQQEIWRRVNGSRRFGEWLKLPGGAFSAQMPAVVACGPIGESLGRVGSLVHDGGSGAGQGGFGGVFGSKNLKAISVLGTNSIEVDDPAALVDSNRWYQSNFNYNVDTPARSGWGSYGFLIPTAGASLTGAAFTNSRRGAGCAQSTFACRQQTVTSSSNDSQCSDMMLMTAPSMTSRDIARVTTLGQQFGINLFVETEGTGYLRDLYMMGELGTGKAIDPAPLDMSQYGTVPWAERLLLAIAAREGIGDEIAEGIVRASNKWGRYEEDSGPNRLLNHIHWGDYWHHSALPYWLFGSLYGDRDCNEHTGAYGIYGGAYSVLGTPHEIGPEEMVNRLTEGYGAYTPFAGDPFMHSQTWQGPNGEYMDDALETGWYSPHTAKMIAWHRYHSRSWQQGMGNCCWQWGIGSMYFAAQGPETAKFRGAAPEAEERFFQAVTGKNMSFSDVMDIGKRVWNLDRAIWVLQGRHRDMEHFTASREYEYPGQVWPGASMPMYRNGVWEYDDYDVPERSPFVDREAHEVLKTHYAEVEGWDTTSGWPTRATLEALDLGFVADKLQAAGRLGT